MRVDVLTIFPEMINQAVSHSIIGRALEAGIVDIRAVDIRNFAVDRHKMTDDTPCGGGGGMIMKPEPIAAALDHMLAPEEKCRVILTDPQGKVFSQPMARELAREEHFVILCGHYEGVDERVKEHMVTDLVSIGDYVLTGGELPALVMLDAVVRLQPGVLGDESAPDHDTFSDGLLEHPHYTRPREFRGWKVPDILFSGHHAAIERWRLWHRLHRTRSLRPDLWERYQLSPKEEKLLAGPEPTVETR